MATLIERIGGHLLPTEQEVEELRTRHGRLFRGAVVQGRQQFRYAAVVSPLYYRTDPFNENEALQAIDLDINLTPEMDYDAACETNGYQMRFWQSRQIAGRTVRYIAQYRRAGKSLTLAPVGLYWINNAGQRQLISRPQAGIIPTIDNIVNTVTWTGCFGPGLDFSYNLKPDHFFKTLIINNKTNLPAPVINLNGLRLVLVMALSWDGTPNNNFAASSPPIDISGDDEAAFSASDEELIDPEEFSYKDDSLRDVFWMKKPRAWDSYDSDEVPHTVNLIHRLRRIGSAVFALLSVTATQLNAAQAVYPVFIDTAIGEELISASADSARSFGSTWPGLTNFANTDGATTVGWTTVNACFCNGWRFLTVPIPQGAYITSATLQVYDEGSKSGTPSARCYGDDHADSAVWASGSNVATGTPGYRTRTTAVSPTYLIGVATGFLSFDITTVAKEIVDIAEWAEGSMGFMLVSDHTSWPGVAEYGKFHTLDNVTPRAAKFNASYSIPTAFTPRVNCA